ncbi:MAG: 50S ribosomal protein L29 [Candidatus Woesearchaeota archaeon]
MKFKELKEMTSEQREKKLKEARIELTKLQAQVASGTPPKNPGQIGQLKRMIARLNTLDTQKKRTV